MEEASKTQIVATLGPSSDDKETISKMIAVGLDVVRLNFSWGDHKGHGDFIKITREAGKENEREIPILADLSGPRVQYDSGGHGISEDFESVITEKDKKDLEFVLKEKVEYIALSYVGSPSDVLELKELIAEINKDEDYEPKVVAKIERRMAVQNMTEIIETADLVMVARGDLGSEVPLESIPFIQYDIIKEANRLDKPVIVATEMMPSMVEREIPSRSDVTDVAYAILSGADGVMLSNETAVGKYPVKTVEMMEKIAVEAEKHKDISHIHKI